jgi:serine/threonine protein kinase
LNFVKFRRLVLVLELCAGTLAQCFTKEYNGPEFPPDAIVLYQIANGLHYIHSRNLVHRDVKPENILISKTLPIQMKLSDLGLAKPTNEGCFSQSAIRGTPLWMAPERLEQKESYNLEEETVQTDTYSTGCVFFYFLTRGWHPFVENILIEDDFKSTKNNIIHNKPVGLESKKGKYYLSW